MNFFSVADFDNELELHTSNVNRIFERVFQRKYDDAKFELSDLKFEIDAEKIIAGLNEIEKRQTNVEKSQSLPPNILSSLEKSDVEIYLTEMLFATVKKLSDVSPHFTEMLAANPNLINHLPAIENDFAPENYLGILLSEVKKENDFAHQIAALRKIWSRFLFEIITFDVFEKISLTEAKKAQTRLAEASIETAIFITKTNSKSVFRLISKTSRLPFSRSANSAAKALITVLIWIWFWFMTMTNIAG